MDIEDLCNIVGWDFVSERQLTRNDLVNAHWVVKQLFPKNKSFKAGSVFINGTGKDLDIVMKGDARDCIDAMAIGFEECGRDYGPNVSPFKALRYGYINLIIILKPSDFRGFYIASRLCKKFVDVSGIYSRKVDRVLIHEQIRRLINEKIDDNVA